MKAVVTGAAGFIGSHLTDALLDRGDHVTGVDAFTDSYARERKLANLGGASRHDAFTLVEADLSGDDLRPLLEGMDVVFHLAAQPGVREAWGPRYSLYLRNNLQATQRLLESARAFPGLRVVFASSSSVYGASGPEPVAETAPVSPISPYGQTKFGAEQLCRIYRSEHGVSTAVLRYFTVFGPRQRPDMAFTRFLTAALAGEPLELLGDGTQTRDFTYVSDAVAATLAAAGLASEHCDVPFNVGGGAPASVARVLDLIEDLTDRPLELRRLARQAGEPLSTAADTSRAREVLGFEPRTDLRTGLEEQLRWVAQATSSPPAARSRSGASTG